MNRLVIIGSNGFVGSAILNIAKSNNFEIFPINREAIDLISNECTEKLNNIIMDGDIVVLAAAKAPAKNLSDLYYNINLINLICNSLKYKRLNYLLNISSDAIFADSNKPINEASPIGADNVHSIMHCMREKIINHSITSPVGHIRPTLIFGENDPHNGYGPNRFIREANSNQNINLFGNGEERRDHIHIDDVANIAMEMIKGKICKSINAVTGNIVTFQQIAKECIKNNDQLKINNLPRSGPMPHNGYREFDNSALKEIFSNYNFTDVIDYVREKTSNALL